MSDYEQAVFISYAWKGESEEIVNQIDRALQERGIKIIRDKRDLGYKGSIAEFMERIGRGSCIVVVISDKYLRSKNCMFELVEIAEHKQFSDRVFPIVLSDAKIYDPVDRLDYVEYWEAEKAKLNQRIKSLSDVSNLQGINEELNNYDRFRDRISGLTSTLKDMNTLTPDMHRDSDFSDLYGAVEKRLQEGPSVPAEGQTQGESKTTESARPAVTNVSASNNSVALGGIQIGGSVNGNINIGNNNQK
jgi:internalin A